ncbi:MAG: DUF4340 domain-containing protein [Bacteroidia bacterium]|nr:DUF4340 domain-containing protein [Bacteroidia bacterium]
MRKSIIIIALVSVALLCLWTIFDKDKQTSYRDISRFAVENPEEISLIKMKDRQGNEVILSKKDEDWYVNNKIKTFKPKIESLLNETIKNIRIKGPVAKTAQQNVIRKMVGRSIHVQIFQKDECIRDYYVGSSNPDRSSTYIHINGSNTPYEAHIFGFANLLEPKFSTLEKDWFDQTIFDFSSEQIESIKVIHHQDSSESFQIARIDSSYNLIPQINNFSQSAARSYFSLFSFKNFEGFANYLNQEQKDSIKNAQPFISIKVTPTSGKPIELKLHRKGSFEMGNSLYDKRGQLIVEDTERYFATFTDFPFLVTVQEYTMGKLLVKKSYFRP